MNSIVKHPEIYVPLFFHKDQIISLGLIELWKQIEKKNLGGKLDREGVIKDMVITLMLLQNSSKWKSQ